MWIFILLLLLACTVESIHDFYEVEVRLSFVLLFIIKLFVSFEHIFINSLGISIGSTRLGQSTASCSLNLAHPRKYFRSNHLHSWWVKIPNLCCGWHLFSFIFFRWERIELPFPKEGAVRYYISDKSQIVWFYSGFLSTQS